ncbi:MAG TPA: hypothetical protein VF320_06265, partial [Acidimicrobiales bacterium]
MSDLEPGRAIDPLDPGLRADPYPAYRRWRDQQPSWRAPDGALIVARYADVEALLRSRGISSAQPGGEAGAPVGALAEHGRWVMIASDGADHARRRSVVAPAFSPGAVEALRPVVADHVAQLLDAIDPHEPVDFVHRFTARLPVLTVAALLGLPVADAPRVRAWTAAFTDGLEPWAEGKAAARSGRALEEMGEYLSGHLEARRGQPRDDLLSRLATSDDLNDDEVLQNGLLLLNAGLDTSGDLLANAVTVLHAHPEQWLAVCGDPAATVAGAIEEVLRFESPVQFAMRRSFGPDPDDPDRPPVTVATHDAARPRVDLPTGQPVLLALGAANRDP